ncbi:glycoside hydrolase family 15 protein [Streptomyces sp. NPDC090022]|uniref:glycoside hydrolase family 15 protein n=1 Tax=Streptomyces sp. NPDC090022 TaxID=3365920 RepID=UPI003803DE51
MRVLHGRPDVSLRFEPRGGAAVPASADELRLRCPHQGLEVLLRCSRPLPVRSGEATLRAGERIWIALQRRPGERPARGAADDPLADTVRQWGRWSGQLVQDVPQRRLVHRSAITLELLDHFANGAIVAAATSSLPERIGGDRNWDYCCAWIRDAQAITRHILDAAWDPVQRALTEHLAPGGGLDASVLALPLRRVLPAGQPRMVATCQAVSARLDAGGGLLYRYLPEESPDGVGGPEGAFLLRPTVRVPERTRPPSGTTGSRQRDVPRKLPSRLQPRRSHLVGGADRPDHTRPHSRTVHARLVLVTGADFWDRSPVGRAGPDAASRRAVGHVLDAARDGPWQKRHFHPLVGDLIDPTRLRSHSSLRLSSRKQSSEELTFPTPRVPHRSPKPSRCPRG